MSIFKLLEEEMLVKPDFLVILNVVLFRTSVYVFPQNRALFIFLALSTTMRMRHNKSYKI